MLESLKKFLKVYPLPIFVLLFSFVIYYSAFEIIRKKEITPIAAETEADSMLSKENKIATNIAESPTKPFTESNPTQSQQEVQATENLSAQEVQNQPIQPPKTYLSTNVKSLNIRQEPSTTAAIAGKLTPTEQVILLEEKGDWILIADAGDEKPLGWIMKKFSYEITFPIQVLSQEQNIELPKSLVAPVSTTANKIYVTSNVRSLNIRQEPNATSAVIGKLTPSHKVILLEQRGEWIMIGTSEEGKVLGWILKSYTQEIPKEIMISDTKPANVINTESNPIPAMPSTLVPTQNNAPLQQTITNAANLNAANAEIPNVQNANTPIQNTQDTPIYTSKVPSLNIRELPSTDTPIIGKLTPNDSVIIVETQDAWVRILDANTPSIKNGWVVRRSLVTRQ
ncbi:SH3 domain-containing protein [Helicobacter sp. UBA3407]|nr:SH3 domain-containing protein [Helicobacter sp. UBA3407]